MHLVLEPDSPREESVAMVFGEVQQKDDTSIIARWLPSASAPATLAGISLEQKLRLQESLKIAVEWDIKGDSSVCKNIAIEVRFSLASGKHWYGLGHLFHQHWPLERGMLPMTPLLTWDNGPQGLSTVLDPTFLSATGVKVSVPSDKHALNLNVGKETCCGLLFCI